MSQDRRAPIDRRDFLLGAATAGAALGIAGLTEAAAAAAPRRNAVPSLDLTAELGTPAELPALSISRSGAGFMVDVLKTLDIDYLAANPGSSFRGLQESLANYGGNVKPEFLTCCHEESSVAMAHGYYKMTPQQPTPLRTSNRSVRYLLKIVLYDGSFRKVDAR